MDLSRLHSRRGVPVLSSAARQAWAPLRAEGIEEQQSGPAHPPAVAAGHEPGSTREVILNAAERCFAERGFAGVAMREVAADAGLRNPGSLYHYFRGKRALYAAVLARGLAPLVAMVVESGQKARESRAGSGAVIEVILDRMFDYLAAHPHLPRLIQRAGLDDSRDLHEALSELLLPFWAEGLRVLRTVAGRWEATDIPHLAAGIYHLIFGYFADAALLAALLQRDPCSPAALARQRRFIKAAVAQLLDVTDPQPRGDDT